MLPAVWYNNVTPSGFYSLVGNSFRYNNAIPSGLKNHQNHPNQLNHSSRQLLTLLQQLNPLKQISGTVGIAFVYIKFSG